MFEESGCETALSSAIDLAKELYDELDATAALRSYRANNYAVALAKRYWQKGEPDDLHESTRLGEEAVAASSQAAFILSNPIGTRLSSPGLEVHTLSTLAARLDERFQLTGSLDDLSRSIDIMKRLVAAVPWEGWQASRAEWLGNLAASLQRRYEQSEDESHSDIDQAVDLSREALSLTDENDLHRPSALSTLANALGGRARGTRRMDIDEAIGLLREAHRITTGNRERGIEIDVNLAIRLFQRYDMTDIDSESETDLDQATKVATSALDRTPDDHPSRAHLENFLGLFYHAQFFRSPSDSSLQEALAHFWEALRSPQYPSVFRRVQAGRMILHLCCATAKWQAAYEAAVTAVELIPKLSSRSIRNADKQRLLSTDDVVGFGADAAAAALHAGQDGYAALRLLEMGRQSLAASVAEMRVDLVSLRREHPAFAQRFIRLRDELQTNSRGQHRSSVEFDALLDEIRQIRGFESFLKPPSDEDIREAARDGPIVMLNASEYRGVDAILIERDRVHVLSIGGVTLEDLETWSGNRESAAFLEWLWDSIAKPVLDELRLPRPSPNGALPRMWWIPTGIFSKVPLHAAGRHSAGSTDSVIDRVVSSYSTSIKALLDARRRASSPPQPKQSKALLVAMAETPGCRPLGCAADEIIMVEGLLASKGFDSIQLGDSKPRKQVILEHLEACRIFHYAGHGVENVSDPLRSALLLDDWKTDPMTVGSVLDVNLSENSPFLAYLAACETGQVTRSKFQDESIHLIGAYQLAGFRHVIGTLWSVGDEASVLMATSTYENLLDDMTDESVCRSLHKAACGLRDEARRCKGGEDRTGARKIELEESSEDELGEDGRNWIPFVHFGV
ncbi:hypothetical protein ACJ41O_011947 [Fusarium nematophilum]